MHTIKITPNFLFEYRRTSGKFIRFPNRIESKKNRFNSENRIESNRNFFCPNWNALPVGPECRRGLITQRQYVIIGERSSNVRLTGSDGRY